MKKDENGFSITTTSDAVVTAINHFTNQVVYSGPDAGKILKAGEVHPNNLMLQCLAAILCLYAQEENYTTKARLYLANAANLLNNVTQRERLIYQAAIAWLNLDYELAITILMAMTEIWPTDCLAAKMAEWLFYCTGQRYWAHRFLTMCEAMARHNKKNPAFMAMYSFALELSGKSKPAYNLAMRAIDIEPATPWAHHTLSHVYLLTPTIQKGIKAMESFKPLWKNILPPLRGHNTWHLGLLYLADLNQQKTEKIASDIWGKAPDTVLEQIDAIALLWRMEMAGMPKDEKWPDIASHLHQHSFDHFMPFNNAHFIYALARNNDKEAVKETLQKIESYASSQTAHSYKVWHTVGLPLLKGCVAFANQDYQLASDILEKIMPEVFCVGGSDAQDELFLQTYYLSLLKSGQFTRANNFFKKYLAYYAKTPLGKYWSTLKRSRVD